MEYRVTPMAYGVECASYVNQPPDVLASLAATSLALFYGAQPLQPLQPLPTRDRLAPTNRLGPSTVLSPYIVLRGQAAEIPTLVRPRG